MKLIPYDRVLKAVQARYPDGKPVGVAASDRGRLTFPLEDLRQYRARGKTDVHVVVDRPGKPYLTITTFPLDELEVEGAPDSTVQWYAAEEARTWPIGTLILVGLCFDGDVRDHIDTVILGAQLDSFTGEPFTASQHIDAIVAEYGYTHFATLPTRLPDTQTP